MAMARYGYVYVIVHAHDEAMAIRMLRDMGYDFSHTMAPLLPSSVIKAADATGGFAGKNLWNYTGIVVTAQGPAPHVRARFKTKQMTAAAYEAIVGQLPLWALSAVVVAHYAEGD